MELFLIRHAESKNNIRKNDQDRVSDPEITGNGRLQSNHLAQFIEKGLHLPVTYHEKNEKFPIQNKLTRCELANILERK